MQQKRVNHKNGKLIWNRLDNTANLFPVIATKSMTNVYRISVTLTEEINREKLQTAVERVLEYFDVFQFCLKKGIFWYYFETNKRPLPQIEEENLYPCTYIERYENNEYLFRVSYFDKRINLEVFHALTDGNGALAFLKEITYMYLRMTHEELADTVQDALNTETSLDYEDSYLDNYKRKAARTYKTEKAVVIKGTKLSGDRFGVMHGYIPVAEIKKVAKSYNVTINQYLLAVYTWAIYVQYLKKMSGKKPITISVPVNLRPYFDSATLKNFFVIVSSVFHPYKENCTFEEILAVVKESLEKQTTKENLEKLFSYNVSNEKMFMLRIVPLAIKKLAIKFVYLQSAHANTSTVTNLGLIKVEEAYKKYIKQFHVIISMSEGQNIKGTVISYDETMVFTFSSYLKNTSIQREFFRKLTEDGINVSIETNGVYYE